MTRAAEFCYIAENAAIGRFMRASSGNMVWWTDDPELAVRSTRLACAEQAKRAASAGVTLAFKKKVGI